MISRFCASIVMSMTLVGHANGFSPNSIQPLARSTKLHSHAIDSESDAMYMMMKAKACAHSDTCSIEDAEHYLQEIMHLQSNCVSGNLASERVCQDIQFPAEVVASLRTKIAQRQQSPSSWMNPIFAGLAATYIVTGAYSMAHNPAADAFTLQEWWWSLRDGYSGDMLSSFFKYGGLPAMDPVTITPFTPQEWWWSVRDGYFGDMLAYHAKSGGLISVASSDDASIVDDVTLAFLPEEWELALKDGYISNMLSHYFKHGGL